MKKPLTVFAVFCVLHVHSQGVTQSAEGKSTIPIRGTAIGIDLGKTELSFGYNNLNGAVETKAVRPVFGAEVRVKNEEGLGNLFSAGDLVPSGSLNLYGGVTFSNIGSDNQTTLTKLRNAEVDRFKKWQTDFRKSLDTELGKLIDDRVKGITDGNNRTVVFKKLKDPLASLTNKEEYFEKISGLSDDDAEIQVVYDQVKEYAKLQQKAFTKEKTAFVEKLKDYYKQFSATNNRRLTPFVFGGINAIGFKQFTGVDSSNLANSTKDIDERGGQFGLGINYQWRNIWLGFTFSRLQSNNFSLLKKKEYTIRKTINLAPSSLVEETKVTAYSGTYGEVDLSNVNVDVVMRIRLDKEYKNYMLLNPYLRGSVASSDTALLPNKTNLGIGLYFLPNNSKFLGGIYLELPDVANNAEKRKDADEQNLRPPFKRLSFGIVTKLNLSTIMGW